MTNQATARSVLAADAGWSVILRAHAREHGAAAFGLAAGLALMMVLDTALG